MHDDAHRAAEPACSGRGLAGRLRTLLQGSVVGLLQLVVLPDDRRLLPQATEILQQFALHLALGDPPADVLTRIVERTALGLAPAFELQYLIPARHAHYLADIAHLHR